MIETIAWSVAGLLFTSVAFCTIDATIRNRKYRVSSRSLSQQ